MAEGPGEKNESFSPGLLSFLPEVRLVFGVYCVKMYLLREMLARESVMKEKAKLISHIVFVLLILIIGWYVGRMMSYSMSGTDANREIKIIRHTVVLLIEVGLIRMIAYGNRLFHITDAWLYSFDFGISALLSRVLESILSKHSMVWFRIAGRSFDFFDICIGICCSGMVLWLIPFLIRWYQYKRIFTEGKTRKEKRRWEWKVQFQMMKAIVIPLDELENDLEKICGND